MIIIIPGAVIAALTIPGVILHEMAHKFFCDFYLIPVYEVKYFRFSKNAGHVIHAKVNNSRQNAVIALAPLLINSVVCFLLLIPTILPAFMGTLFVSTYSIIDILLTWIGVACGLNALPSKTDLSHVDTNISWRLRFIKRLVQILNIFEFWGNLLWLLIIIFLPLLLFRLLCPI